MTGHRAMKSLAVALTASVVLPFSAPSLGHAGPAPSLCEQNDSRGPVPENFPMQACVDGDSIWLRNDLSVPVTIQVTGNIGDIQKVQIDQSPAAVATRLIKSDPNIIMPNDLVRIPIGEAEAKVSLINTDAGGTYIEAATLAAFTPAGTAGAVGQALAQLVVDTDNTARAYAECVIGKNALQRAGCEVKQLAATGFNTGKAIASGFAKGVAGLLVNTAFWVETVSKQVPDVSTILKGERNLIQGGRPQQPAPAEEPAPAPAPAEQPAPAPAPAEQPALAPAPVEQPAPAPANLIAVDAYSNYGDANKGHAMCRGNPNNALSMPGGRATQSFTVGSGVSTLDSALVQIDPDAAVTAYLALNVNGQLRAQATAAAAGDTRFYFSPVAVAVGDAVQIDLSFTASAGKIITVYTAGNPGGTFQAMNSCADGAPQVATSTTGLRALVSGTGTG